MMLKKRSEQLEAEATPLLELDPVEGVQKSISDTVSNGGDATSAWVTISPDSDDWVTPDTVGPLLLEVASSEDWAAPTPESSVESSKCILHQSSSVNGFHDVPQCNDAVAQPALTELESRTLAQEEPTTAGQSANCISNLDFAAATAAPSIAATAVAAAVDGTAAVADGDGAGGSGMASLAALPGLLIACKIDNLRRILDHPMVRASGVVGHWDTAEWQDVTETSLNDA